MKIAVVIPCYKVQSHILNVINSLPDDIIDYVIAVNDASPDNTYGILKNISETNSKLYVLENASNLGVGGAMMTGYRKALELNADIVIKIDGDGQMNPNHISSLIEPIISKQADFTKGNRFRNLQALQKMPFIRRLGNIGLSFLTKAASGYWNIFDPSNGFTAISNNALSNLDFSKLHNRYFFETSVLINLYYQDAVIKDVSMDALYGNEVSNLSVSKTLIEFPPKLIHAFLRRILYKYFLYDFNMASIYLIAGFPLLIFGSLYGLINLIEYGQSHLPAPTGTVVIPTLLITLGFQLILSAINIDLNNYPKKN